LSRYLECSRKILQFCVDLLVLGTKGLQRHHFMLCDPPQHDHIIWEGSVGKLQLLQLWDSCESSAHCWLTSKITIYVSTYRRPRFPHLVSRWYYWALVDSTLSVIAPVPFLLFILVLNFFYVVLSRLFMFRFENLFEFHLDVKWSLYYQRTKKYKNNVDALFRSSGLYTTSW
jgi:hypothetical protein